MKVLFSCTTGYHLFISQFLVMTHYKDRLYKKIIFLSDLIPDVEIISSKLEENNFWDEIIVIKEKDYYSNHSTNIEEKVEELNSISKYDFSNIDLVHIFTLDPMTNNIIRNLKSNNNIILTEDGVATYVLESIKTWVDKMSYVNKIWIFDKRLYIGKAFLDKVENIEVDKYIQDSEFLDQFCKNINFIFSYDEKNEIGDVLFFDQDFSSYGSLTEFEEQIFLNKLNKCIGNKSVSVKKHHTDFMKNKFSKFSNFHLISTKENVPWQVIYINNMKKFSKNTYITYNSTAILTNKILNKNDKSKLIFMYKLIYANEPYWEKYITKYIELYGNDNIKIAESFEDIRKILEVDESNCVFEKEIPHLPGNEWTKCVDIVKSNTILNEMDFFGARIRLGYLKERFINSKPKYLIWGAGGNGVISKNVIDNILPNFNFIGYVDKFKEGYFNETRIYKTSELVNIEFDYIIIATTPGKNEAIEFLNSLGLKIGYNFIPLIM